MFGLFRSHPLDDPVLGRLERKRGFWRGLTRVPDFGGLPLLVAGPRHAPDPECLRAARDLKEPNPALRPAIENALVEHRAADDGLPPLRGAIWDGVTVLGLLVERDGGITATLGLQTAWDEEHTLGAILRDGRLIELNGSIRDVFA